mgnify:FL=1|jgi:tRNA threonylcarbamoyladenosine biosynthesis protein TsaB|tara:strand:+ start:15363 stop:16058 length:696 start_codon:yes stop_codon:yes gene_type:complete
MNILAIDTTTSSCSAALLLDHELITQCQVAERNHTQLILPMVDALLNKGGLKLSQISVIAFTSGPGSFTGIRVGFGIVQGLAFGADLPVLPVSSLETLAHTAIRKLKLQKNTHIIPMLDARMHEIYWAQFNYNSGNLTRINADCVSPPEALSAVIKNPSIMIGDGLNYSDRLPEKSLDFCHISLLPEAQDIFKIACPLIEKGEVIDIQEASPMYLRNQITWKKHKKLRQAK